jgi:uncharacterized glyoxalase superfamily protein PhnB
MSNIECWMLIMNFSLFTQTKSEDAAQRKRAINAILIAVLVHVVFIVLAISLTILIIAPKPKMMFEGKKSPSLPARKLEHSIRVQQMQKQTRKPQILQRLVTEAPSKVALPEMPDMKTPDVKNLRDTPLMNTRAGSIGGIGGAGGGAGRGLTGGTGYSDTKFFGENVRTKAVAICMDISPSMVQKGVTQDVLAEATKMLETMGVSTKFNLVVFVDGSLSFSEQMVFATQENKAKAIEWLKQPFDGRRQGNLRGHSGSTPHMAIKAAVDMGADTVFILSDDPPYLKKGDAATGVEITTHMEDIEKYVRSIESTTGRSVRFYPILYKPFENERGKIAAEYYKKMARSTGGRSKVIPRGK